ncbi:hypothetical protein V5P93_006712 [Actinokineospora auranticolor]|uniref:Uncharacterized protein n=1 Tax=Actinokineospora auranticolor TaxID=155976 RepID=A0A2S6GWM0_9PSEU|nr:hypothetical protein [Actinokineospora auranticolor]PPK69645.1 hypothetical protein CLV40_103255 [Actinokineospora auranticolor]
MRIVLTGADDLARALRDAGAEVVYLTDTDPARVAATAVQEDADAVVAATALPAITALLADNGAEDIAVVAADGALAWLADTAGE